MTDKYTYTYDDRDEHWTFEGTNWDFTADPKAYMNTLASTAAVTNLTINFEGAMQLIGMIGNSTRYGEPVMNFYLDGKYVDSQSGTFGEAKTNDYNIIFFQTDDNISSGKHELVLENAEANNRIFLDYFAAAGPAYPSSSSVVSSPVPITTVVTRFLTPTSSSSGGSARSAGEIGAIVGGTVGGVALLLGIGVAFFFWRRRKRGVPYYYKSVAAGDLLGGEFREEPKDPPPQQPTTASTAVPSRYDDDGYSSYTADRPGLGEGDSRYDPSVPVAYPPSVGRSLSMQSSTVASSARTGVTGQSGTSSVRPLLLGKAAAAHKDREAAYGKQEEDSGLRFNEAGVPISSPKQDIAPAYSEI